MSGMAQVVISVEMSCMSKLVGVFTDIEHWEGGGFR